MTESLQLLRPALLWLPACVALLSVNLFVALSHRPWGNARWLIAAAALCVPALFPSRAEYQPHDWGMLNTIFTTLVIVTAARLPDLDNLLKRKSHTRFDLLLWMSIPVARRLARPHKRAALRRRAPRYLAKAAIKRLAWEPFAFLISQVPADSVPWPLKSALLMLYFVLCMTALHDLAVGLCLLCGIEVDELFDAPLLARSPRDFWSRRWNKFISRFALKHVALPMRHRLPPTGSLFLVFACSGLFHEYFAWGVGGSGATYGAMMLFFLIQAAVVWLGSLLHFRLSPWLSQPLTFIYMCLTAPLFFVAVKPALLAFSYPSAWLPF